MREGAACVRAKEPTPRCVPQGEVEVGAVEVLKGRAEDSRGGCFKAPVDRP